MREQNYDALADALRLAACKRPSFPCNANKKPACPNGFKDATTDPKKLRELWRQYSGPLVGVPTGEPSGLDVVDIDNVKHPEANDWLDANAGRLPDTRQHATPSGGSHLLFKHRAGFKCSTGRLHKGVDTRGDGGYIIWWPFHLGLGAHHRLDVPLADLPDWIFEQLKPAPAVRYLVSAIRLYSASHKVRGILQLAENAAEGERNNIIFWCANRFRDMAACGELSEFQFNGACSDLMSAASRSGLPIGEARRTIASAMRARS